MKNLSVIFSFLLSSFCFGQKDSTSTQNQIVFSEDRFIYYSEYKDTLLPIKEKVWIMGSVEYNDNIAIVSKLIGFRLNPLSFSQISDFDQYDLSNFKLDELKSPSEKDSKINTLYFQLIKSFFPYSEGANNLSEARKFNMLTQAKILFNFLDQPELECIKDQLNLLDEDPKDLLEKAEEFQENKDWAKAHIYGWYHGMLCQMCAYGVIEYPDNCYEKDSEKGYDIYEAWPQDYDPYEDDCSLWHNKGIAVENRIKRWCHSLGDTKYILILK